ncbi:MAG: hypothetical protein MHMPM18_000623 [Marteilia pararefringens]
MTLSILVIVDKSTATQILSTIIEDDQLVDLIIKVGTRIATGVLIAGIFLLLVAGFGCFGTVSSNATLLSIYLASVTILSIITFAVIIVIAVNKNKTMKRVYDHLFVKLSTGYDGKHSGESLSTLTIDAIQIQFNCCGIFGAADYDSASTWTERSYEAKDESGNSQTYSNLSYPASCCDWNPDEKKIFTDPLHFRDIDTCLRHSSGEVVEDAAQLKAASNFDVDCKSKIGKFIDARINVVFVVTSIILVLEFASIFAAYVFKREAMDYEDY